MRTTRQLRVLHALLHVGRECSGEEAGDISGWPLWLAHVSASFILVSTCFDSWITAEVLTETGVSGQHLLDNSQT
jgi:hypothetical protein